MEEKKRGKQNTHTQTCKLCRGFSVRKDWKRCFCMHTCHWSGSDNKTHILLNTLNQKFISSQRGLIPEIFSTVAFQNHRVSLDVNTVSHLLNDRNFLHVLQWESWISEWGAFSNLKSVWDNISWCHSKVYCLKKVTFLVNKGGNVTSTLSSTVFYCYIRLLKLYVNINS